MRNGHPIDESRVAIGFCLLDNLFMCWPSTEEHIDQARPVMTLLYDASVTLSLKNCTFLQFEWIIFGHVIRPGWFKVSKRTNYAIHGLESPTHVKELRSFQGLYHSFQCFVLDFSCAAVYLNKKICKGKWQTFDGLTDDEVNSLETQRQN